MQGRSVCSVPDLIPPRTPPDLAAISDFRDGWRPADPASLDPTVAEAAWLNGDSALPPQSSGTCPPPPVLGGYLEHLPLACVQAGLVDNTEIWTGWRSASPAPFGRENARLMRRAFRLDADAAPFRSTAMTGFVRAFGAPKILCVWGLGVDAALLDACATSFRIYNSIDAPALRIAPEQSARFDLVLTGSDAQTAAVRERHPAMPCLVLPIGPEFADPVTFRPRRWTFSIVPIGFSLGRPCWTTDLAAQRRSAPRPVAELRSPES